MHFLSSTYDIKEHFKEHLMVFKGVFYLYNITINTPSTVSKYLWSKMVDCYIPFKGIIQDEKIKNRNLMYKKSAFIYLCQRYSHRVDSFSQKHSSDQGLYASE